MPHVRGDMSGSATINELKERLHDYDGQGLFLTLQGIAWVLGLGVLTIGVTATLFEPATGHTGSLGVAFAVSHHVVSWNGRRSGEDD